MTLLSEQDAADLQALVPALIGEALAGVPVTTLASQIGLPPSRVKALLAKNSGYFVAMKGGQRYALNRFTKHRGTRDLILADIQKVRARSRLLASAGFWVGLVLAAISLIVPLAVRVATGTGPILPWLILALLVCAASLAGTVAMRRFA